MRDMHGFRELVTPKRRGPQIMRAKVDSVSSGNSFGFSRLSTVHSPPSLGTISKAVFRSVEFDDQAAVAIHLCHRLSHRFARHRRSDPRWRSATCRWSRRSAARARDRCASSLPARISATYFANGMRLIDYQPGPRRSMPDRAASSAGSRPLDTPAPSSPAPALPRPSASAWSEAPFVTGDQGFDSWRYGPVRRPAVFWCTI